jgi:hypothetical protein
MAEGKIVSAGRDAESVVGPDPEPLIITENDIAWLVEIKK